MAYVNSHEEIIKRMLASSKSNCFRCNRGESILELTKDDFLDFDTVAELVQHPWLVQAAAQATFFRFSKSKEAWHPYETGCTHLMAEHDQGFAAFVEGYIAHYDKLDLPKFHERKIPTDYPMPREQKFKIGDKVRIRGKLASVEYSYWQRYNNTLSCNEYHKHIYCVKDVDTGNSWAWAEEAGMEIVD